MHIIVYTSEITTDQGSAEEILANIVAKAKINNPRFDITGLLFYHNLRFLQIIEGSQEALEKLMDVIRVDSRHKNIKRIIDEDIYEKSFVHWNMDYLNLSQDETIDIEELELIRDVYKKNMNIDTGILAYFYKAMLESHELVKAKE